MPSQRYLKLDLKMRFSQGAPSGAEPTALKNAGLCDANAGRGGSPSTSFMAGMSEDVFLAKVTRSCPATGQNKGKSETVKPLCKDWKNLSTKTHAWEMEGLRCLNQRSQMCLFIGQIRKTS